MGGGKRFSKTHSPKNGQRWKECLQESSPFNDTSHNQSQTANITGRRELAKEEQEIPTVHTGNFY